MVGFPSESAIFPKIEPNRYCVNLYVHGLTTNKKINAEKIEIAHFLELEGGDDIIQYINI